MRGVWTLTTILVSLLLAGACGTDTDIPELNLSADLLCVPGSGASGSFTIDQAEAVEELVQVSFDEPVRCSWTLDEVAAGIEIPYTVTINQALSGTPIPQDAGNCAQPDASGLIRFETIGDLDWRYGLFDLGLCSEDNPEPLSLVPGSYAHSFSWDGRAFAGESDTGQEPGEAFPAGSYTLQLDSVFETTLEGDSEPSRITFSAALLVHLVD